MEESATTVRLSERQQHLQRKVKEGKESSGKIRYAVEVEIPRVEAAFARIQDGTYGLCIDCGESIEEKRLAAMPEIPTCRGCATSESELIRKVIS